MYNIVTSLPHQATSLWHINKLLDSVLHVLTYLVLEACRQEERYCEVPLTRSFASSNGTFNVIVLFPNTAPAAQLAHISLSIQDHS